MLPKEIGYVAGRDRRSCRKRQKKLLEEIGYVVETVSIFGRTTAVVHAVANCYTPTIIQTYDTPSFFLGKKRALQPAFLPLYSSKV